MIDSPLTDDDRLTFIHHLIQEELAFTVAAGRHATRHINTYGMPVPLTSSPSNLTKTCRLAIPFSLPSSNKRLIHNTTSFSKRCSIIHTHRRELRAGPENSPGHHHALRQTRPIDSYRLANTVASHSKRCKQQLLSLSPWQSQTSLPASSPEPVEREKHHNNHNIPQHADVRHAQPARPARPMVWHDSYLPCLTFIARLQQKHLSSFQRYHLFKVNRPTSN